MEFGVWADWRKFVPGAKDGPNGIDPVVGISQEPGKDAVKIAGHSCDDLGFKRFVKTKGALYALTPSMSTLRRLASGEQLA